MESSNLYTFPLIFLLCLPSTPPLCPPNFSLLLSPFVLSFLFDSRCEVMKMALRTGMMFNHRSPDKVLPVNIKASVASFWPSRMFHRRSFPLELVCGSMRSAATAPLSQVPTDTRPSGPYPTLSAPSFEDASSESSSPPPLPSLSFFSFTPPSVRVPPPIPHDAGISHEDTFQETTSVP